MFKSIMLFKRMFNHITHHYHLYNESVFLHYLRLDRLDLHFIPNSKYVNKYYRYDKRNK